MEGLFTYLFSRQCVMIALYLGVHSLRQNKRALHGKPFEEQSFGCQSRSAFNKKFPTKIHVTIFFLQSSIHKFFPPISGNIYNDIFGKRRDISGLPYLNFGGNSSSRHWGGKTKAIGLEYLSQTAFCVGLKSAKVTIEVKYIIL
jgi:hypothetical protein